MVEPIWKHLSKSVSWDGVQGSWVLGPARSTKGWNSARVDMVNISRRKFTWFCTSEVVQDFFHQQYHHISQFFSGEMPRLVNMMSCTKMVGQVCWKVHICPSCLRRFLLFGITTAHGLLILTTYQYLYIHFRNCFMAHWGGLMLPWGVKSWRLSPWHKSWESESTLHSPMPRFSQEIIRPC